MYSIKVIFLYSNYICHRSVKVPSFSETSFGEPSFGETAFGVDRRRQSIPWLCKVLHWLRGIVFFKRLDRVRHTNKHTLAQLYYRLISQQFCT